MTRARIPSDPKVEALHRGVQTVMATMGHPDATAACTVLAEGLFAWLRHDRTPQALEASVERTLAGFEAQRAPLFAMVRPEPDRDLTRRLAEHLEGIVSPHDWAWADGELLGAFFEAQLNPSLRKKHGAYYTPKAIVDYLLEACLPPREHPLPRAFRLLDPSCGAGNFLSAALEALFERTWSPEPGAEGRFARLSRVVNEQLFGLDLDPQALRLAQIRLNFLQYRLVPELKAPLRAHLISRDTLVEHAVQLEPGFDAIIGNPPYGAEISPHGKQFFAQHYRLGQGRQDTTALFIERSARLLRPGARLALVVPHGVTRTGAYAGVRQLLLNQLHLRAMIDLGSAFPGVNLETMAFVAEAPRGPAAEPRMPWAPEADAVVRLDSLRDGAITAIGTQSLSFFAGRTLLPIYADRTNGPWITRMERLGTPLQELAAIRRGVGISAREHAIALREPGLPVVRGRDLRRWGDDAGWLRLHDGFLLRDRFAREVVTAPRVGYQNIASSVVATLLPAGCLPLDTVNVLEPDTGLAPDFLLGVLNSRVIEAYFRLAIANKAQLTLHLDTPTLGMLPVIVPGADEQAAIAGLAAEIRLKSAGTSPWHLALELEKRCWESPEALERQAQLWHTHQLATQAEILAVETALESRLASLYELTSSEVAGMTEHVERSRRQPSAAKTLAKAAELMLARGLLRHLEASDRPREAGDLLASWPRPDAELLLKAWGGTLAELPDLLERYGAVVHGRRISLWLGGLELALV